MIHLQSSIYLGLVFLATCGMSDVWMPWVTGWEHTHDVMIFNEFLVIAMKKPWCTFDALFWICISNFLQNLQKNWEKYSKMSKNCDALLMRFWKCIKSASKPCFWCTFKSTSKVHQKRIIFFGHVGIFFLHFSSKFEENLRKYLKVHQLCIIIFGHFDYISVFSQKMTCPSSQIISPNRNADVAQAGHSTSLANMHR